MTVTLSRYGSVPWLGGGQSLASHRGGLGSTAGLSVQNAKI